VAAGVSERTWREAASSPTAHATSAALQAQFRPANPIAVPKDRTSGIE
jgi:hypothetical protein